MKPPVTTYIVDVYKAPHWTTVLSTKSKEKALEALKPLGKHGRLTELTSKRRK
jgi:hypothetical protein